MSEARKRVVARTSLAELKAINRKSKETMGPEGHERCGSQG